MGVPHHLHHTSSFQISPEAPSVVSRSQVRLCYTSCTIVDPLFVLSHSSNLYFYSHSLEDLGYLPRLTFQAGFEEMQTVKCQLHSDENNQIPSSPEKVQQTADKHNSNFNF